MAVPPKVQWHLVLILSQHLSIPTVGGGRTVRCATGATGNVSGWTSGEEKTPSIRHALNSSLFCPDLCTRGYSSARSKAQTSMKTQQEGACKGTRSSRFAVANAGPAEVGGNAPRAVWQVMSVSAELKV